MPDMINHPPHYNASPAKCQCGRRIECIDVTQHMNFNLGNAMKYVWRAEHKNGIEDLKKAVWYLQCEIDRITPRLQAAGTVTVAPSAWSESPGVALPPGVFPGMPLCQST